MSKELSLATIQDTNVGGQMQKFESQLLRKQELIKEKQAVEAAFQDLAQKYDVSVEGSVLRGGEKNITIYEPETEEDKYQKDVRSAAVANGETISNLARKNNKLLRQYVGGKGLDFLLDAKKAYDNDELDVPRKENKRKTKRFREEYRKLTTKFLALQGELESIESGIKDLKEYLDVFQGLAAVSNKKS